MTPNRVNRAHWPTRGNRQDFCIFLHFSGPWKNGPGIAPNGAGSCFFVLIQTFSTFWATRILILRICFFGIFPAHGKDCLKLHQMCPGGVFFCTNADLADILGDTDFDFENLYFLDFQIPGFPDSRLSSSYICPGW